MRRVEHNESIEHLARRMSAFEDQAYEEFSDVFEPKIKGYFTRQGLTLSDAEDLTVSCITDIALKVEKYKEIEGAGFAAWVFTLVRHALVDWLRRRKETSTYIDDIGIEHLIDDKDSEPNFEVIMSVREAIAKLPEMDQTVLQLRYFAGQYSFVEIGERLGMRPDTVRVRHHRAIDKMKSLLQRDSRLSKILERAGVAG